MTSMWNVQYLHNETSKNVFLRPVHEVFSKKYLTLKDRRHVEETLFLCSCSPFTPPICNGNLVSSAPQTNLHSVSFTRLRRAKWLSFRKHCDLQENGRWKASTVNETCRSKILAIKWRSKKQLPRKPIDFSN